MYTAFLWASNDRVDFPALSQSSIANISYCSRTVTGTNCDAAANSNSGCGVKSNVASSYGESFNSIGGGWYGLRLHPDIQQLIGNVRTTRWAMERTSTKISIWYWPRTASNVPNDVRSGSGTIHTLEWGTPYAVFVSGQGCSISSKFSGSHHIIINLTFCEYSLA